MIWPFIFISYATLFVFGLTDNIRGPLFPEILKYFSLSDSLGATMWALSNISGLAASYVSRFFLKRYDRLSVLQGAALSLAISLWGLALSPNFPFFLIFSFLFGFSLGILGMIPNILVPMGSTPERKQRMLSGLHTMYGLSSLLAPLLAASVAGVAGNWRWTFAAASLAPLLLFAYSLHSSHKSLHTKMSDNPDHHFANKERNFRPQLFLAFMLGLAVSLEIMLSSRLALFMQREWSATMEVSSLYVTYFFSSMMVGRLLFAIIHLKRSPQFLLSASLFFTFVFSLVGLFHHPLFLAFTGFTIAPFFPLTITWISSEFPEDLDSAISYLMTVDAIMLIAMHMLVGQLTDLFNIKTALFLGPLLAILALAMVLSYEVLFKKNPRA
jgi:FHS family glucose/mannose:H+ symporter-like MFS transporter